jgi:ferrous iron transport protein B
MGTATALAAKGGTIALVGHHNVGKSVIFQRLTGRRVTVSNYPGTTVEVARGSGSSDPQTSFIDTPGIITFPAHTEDERATTRALLEEPLRTILQVGDAKNLRRTLLLTLQLGEMGLPMVLALNMQDEASARGVRTNATGLAARLGLTIIPTVAVKGEGLRQLTEALHEPKVPELNLLYAEPIELAIHGLAARLPPASVSARSLALLWLSGDEQAARWVQDSLDASEWQVLVDLKQALRATLDRPIGAEIQAARLAFLDRLQPVTDSRRNLRDVPSRQNRRDVPPRQSLRDVPPRQSLRDVPQFAGAHDAGLASFVGRLSAHRLWGVPVLVSIMGAVYWFVGHFGAGTLVDLLEIKFFEGLLNPWIAQAISRLSPIPLLTEFLVGPYGLWTMGMTYALALILPIVTTFFLAFGVLEDSGYLPRLAVITNRLFSRIGLNGKAVLPMVLGLGCVTMATMTTRVLENRRDRTLATLLLALGIPCSAQLGVTMGLLAGVSLGATLIWVSVVVGAMLTVGWLGARLLPGLRTPLLIELPPIRRPIASNLVVKTLARLEWYLKEVVPLFLLGTAILFVLDLIGILPALVKAGEPLVAGWLGLPAEASEALLMGFLRRDFGATGLFVMQAAGALSAAQITVAMVTITLFIPCVASVFMIAKERGRRAAAGMVALVFPLAFLVGGLLYRLLASFGWGI